MGRRRSEFERPSRHREYRGGGGSGIGGKILALFLGVIIGAGAIAGTVVGVGYSFTKKPVKEAVGSVNSLFDTNIKLDGYLTNEYSSKTIAGLFGSLSSVVSEVKNKTASFGTLAKISPTVEKALGSLANEVIKLGVPVEKDDLVASLMEKPFSELGGYISNDLIGTITLGRLLQTTGKFPFEAMCSDDNKIVRLLLYGVEGTDYRLDTENKKFVPIEGGKPFLTFNGLSNVGGIIEDIPLDALLPVAEDNGPMNALAYGSTQHYAYLPVLDANGAPVIENGKVKKEAVMHPRYYAVTDGNVFDEEGNQIVCTITPAETEGDYVLTFGEGDDATYQYLTPSTTVTGVYDVYTSSSKTVRVCYKKTTFGDFMGEDSDIINSLELAALLNIQTKENPDKIMLALAYGVEGEDYYYDSTGARKFYAGKGPKTVGDLMKDNAMTELMDKLPLDSLLDISPDNDMLLTLAYGNASHYDIKTETINGKEVKTVIMRQVRYTKVGETYYDIDGNAVTVPEDQYLKEVDGVWYAYKDIACTEGEEVLYGKATIGQLSKDGYFESMEVGGLFGVDKSENPDKIMLALAYGVEGVDYYYDSTGARKFYAGKGPKTIGDLTKDGAMTDLMEKMPLDSLIDISADNDILVTIAYGKSSHYDIKTETINDKEVKTVVMRQVRYTLVDGTYYDIDGKATTVPEDQHLKEKDGVYYAYKTAECKEGEEVLYDKTTISKLSEDGFFDSMEVAPLFGVDKSENPDKIMLALAYGVEGEDYYYDSTGARKFYAGKGPKTIGDLTKDGAMTDLMEKLPLDSVMDISPDNDMLVTIAYGKSSHYDIKTETIDGKEVKTVVMRQVRYTKEGDTYYDIDGKATTVPEDQHLKAVDGVYYAYKTAECKEGEEVLYDKTTIAKLSDDTFFDNMEFGALFGIDKSENPDKIMLALAYGIEGEDYYYDSTGARKFYAGKAPKTIGELTEGSTMTDLINKLPLDSVIEVKADNDMLVTLAYGKSSRYDIKTETVDGNEVKTVVMRQVRYTKEGDTYYDIDGKETTLPDGQYLKEKEGVYYAYKTTECKEGEEVLYPKTTIGQLSEDGFFDDMEFGPLLGISPLDKDADALMIALAYGNEGEHFEIKDSDGDGKDDIVWLTDENGQTYGPRTIDEFRTPEKLFEDVYIADALKVTTKSHSVLIALAYGEYEIVGDTIQHTGKKRTVGQLMDADSSIELIDSITLANALSIDANTNSEILKTLAFGQVGKHYDIETKTVDGNEVKTVVMRQVRYTKEGDTYYDIDGKETTLPDGQYLKEKEGVYYAYKSAECKDGDEIKYAKTTLGELGNNPEGLIDNITLGDALGAKDTDDEDPLKRALAYSKDGRAYTIGELKADPNAIIYNIHLDSVMEPTTSAKTTLYLLYGKKGIHFQIVDEPPTGDPATSTKITDDSVTPHKTKYVEMLPQQMTAHWHEVDGLAPHWCLHNEYGELVEGVTLTKLTGEQAVTHPYDNAQYTPAYSYVIDGVTYYLLAPTGETPAIGTIRLKGKKSETGLTDVNRYSPAYYVMTVANGETTYPMYEHNTIAVLAGEDSVLFTHLTERLTLEELMGMDSLASNMFLEPLAHTTIDELPDAINDLRITDVFENKVYATHETSTEDAPIYIDENGKMLEEKDGNWYIQGTTTKSYRVYDGPWKYLLDDCNDERTPESYTVTEIDLLIPNMTSSMQKATLNALDKDGIIDLDEDMLDTDITIKTSLTSDPLTPTFIKLPDRSDLDAEGNPTMKTIDELSVKKLGEMTVEQMLAYIKGLLA